MCVHAQVAYFVINLLLLSDRHVHCSFREKVLLCLIYIVAQEISGVWKWCRCFVQISVELPSTSEAASYVQLGRFGRRAGDNRQVLYVGENTTASMLNLYYAGWTIGVHWNRIQWVPVGHMGFTWEFRMLLRVGMKRGINVIGIGVACSEWYSHSHHIILSPLFVLHLR